MNLQDKIIEDIKSAMKAGRKDVVSVLRMVNAEIHNESINSKKELKDADIVDILAKEVKKRKESIGLYKQGNREDLADQELQELEILSAYLPSQIDESALDILINDIIAETGAESMKDMGKVMASLMPRVKGRADGSKVQEKVRQILS